MDEFQEELKDAICNNDIAFLEKYKKRFSINDRFPDEDNDTLLLYSISDEGSTTFEYFLENHADITLLNDEGENIIHAIVFSGKKERLKGLLNKDNINHQANDGTTPLLLAIVLEKYDIAQILIKGGADINIADTKKNLPIHLACWFGNMPLVEELVNKGANLHERTTKGNLSFAPLLKVGVNENCIFSL